MSKAASRGAAEPPTRALGMGCAASLQADVPFNCNVPFSCRCCLFLLTWDQLAAPAALGRSIPSQQRGEGMGMGAGKGEHPPRPKQAFHP